MGQILHGSAKTTHAIRAAIQRSQASVSELAEKYDLNPKTVRKWRKRTSIEDAPMGPKTPRSTVLSREEEAACVVFRKHTLLPLDDCLYALQASIPHLTRSSLHRLYQRHDISRLPDMKDGAEPKKKFKCYPIGYFHIDIAEVRTEEGKLHMFVAIDRISKFVFVELHDRATRAIASQFLRNLVDAVPYQIHTVLTDNGIEYRLTKPNHPWTNGQVERMNRTLKEATVRRYHYASHDQFREHLQTFVNAYNYAKRLKTLRGLTPFEHIVQCWKKEPKPFKLNPTHHMPGLNI